MDHKQLSDMARTMGDTQGPVWGTGARGRPRDEGTERLS